MFLFYCPDISSDIITLSSEESTHCLRVLRLKKGDSINITDGKGHLYDAVLLDENIKGCTVQIQLPASSLQPPASSFQPPASSFQLHIAIAPTKNISRFEWFLEKCTEIGISTISPLICEHSERRVINTERLNKIIVSALKQSQITYLPILNQPIKFVDFINNNQIAKLAKRSHEYLNVKNIITNKLPNCQSFIAVCDESITKPLKDIYHKENDCIILIGPEGDFSKSEIQLALDNGYLPISLSGNRLRTETAGLLACTTINLLNY